MKSLQSLSYKTLFIIFFLSLAGIVFFLKIGGKTTKVSAAWWDESWHYRKSISVTNSSGSNLTDFQVSISIGTSQLIADGKMQTDCDDIRITDINGNLLPYWIEPTGPNSCNQTADTRVWVKANSLPTSGATIYAYYGNSQSASVSSGTDTFIYFKNNFQTSDVDWNWTNGGVENGWAKTWSTGADNPGSTMTWIKNIINITGQEVVAEFTVKATKSGSTGHDTTNVLFNPTRTTTLYNNTNSSTIANGSGNSIITFGDYGGWYGKVGFDTTTGQASNIANDTTYPTYQFNTDGWVRHVHKLTNSSLLLSGYSLGGLSVGTSAWAYNEKTVTSGYTKPNNIILAIGEQFNESIWLREVFVRKYASTQPIVSLQSEELGTAPIAYYKFDEGVGTTAYDSAGTNNGTLGTGSSAPTWTNESQCISGKCLQFSGSSNSYITVPYSSSQTSSTITMEGWVKRTGEGTNSGRGIFLSKDGANYIEAQDGYFGFSLSINGTQRYNNTNMTNNQWNFVAATFDGTDIKMYINGKLVKTINQPGTLTTTSSNINIGRFNGGNFTFNGYLDDLKIYPYARTAAQIKLDYNSRGSLSGSSANLGVQSNTAPNLNSSLVAYYKFDEGQGTILNNSVIGSTLNLTFTAGKLPTWTNNGKANKGLSFSTSQIEFTDYTNSPIDTPNGVTFSLWAYPTSTNSNRYLMYKLNAYSLSYGDSVCGNGKFGLSVNGGGGSRIWVCALNTSNLNNWYHITGSATPNGKVNIYINGVLSNNSNFPYPSIDVSNSKLTYGDYEGGGYAFSGILDELKIYNTALTADQIKQDYNQGSAISFGQTTQNIGGTTTSLDYCIPGDTSYCTSPVAEWNFEENAGTTAKDTSGNNNNFTFNIGTSAPTWAVGKKNKGSSLQFNGTSNWVQRTLSPSIPANTDYTQCLWFNPTSNTTRQVMIDDANQWEHWIALNTNRTVMGCYYNTAQICTTSTATINLNTWNYTCLSVQSGQKMSLYLNGTLASENTNIGSSLPKIYDDVCVGANGGSVHGEKFTGKIDDVKIYNYARTPAQIAYDYNKGGPVGWWKMDECQGSTINDSSGNNNIGTLSIGQSGTQNSIGTCQIGTSAAWTAGASGHTNASLNFDGTDDAIDAGDNLDLIGSPLTLSAWVKSNSWRSYDSVIDKLANGGNYRFHIDSSGAPNFGIRNSGGSYEQITSTKTLTTNIWHHILVTFDNNTTAKIYIDGNFVNQKTDFTIQRGDTNTKLYIGYASNNGIYFSGQLDDVRIYNYALTSEQIKNVYNGGAVNFQ